MLRHGRRIGHPPVRPDDSRPRIRAHFVDDLCLPRPSGDEDPRHLLVKFAVDWGRECFGKERCRRMRYCLRMWVDWFDGEGIMLFRTYVLRLLDRTINLVPAGQVLRTGEQDGGISVPDWRGPTASPVARHSCRRSARPAAAFRLGKRSSQRLASGEL